MISTRAAAASDATAIAAIYAPYVADTIVTFEEQVVSAAEMARRIERVDAMPLPWRVAEVDGRVVGYCHAGPWKSRAAYRHAAEIAVYVDRDLGGQGIGSALFADTLPRLAEMGVHTVLGGIALPNEASVALHEKFGFRKVAHLEQVGFKLGRWVDVGYWQRLL